MKKEQLNQINLDQTPTYITDTSEPRQMCFV